MIKPTATVTIQRIPLRCLLASESRPRYASMVLLYVQQMQNNPHDDPGFLRVFPSRTHRGLFELDDGYHRFVAHIIVGREDALCAVIEEKEETHDAASKETL